jgi:SAM-dependent methyltransferase
MFCGTSGHPVVVEENGFTGRQCPTCRLIYVSPRPSQAEIQARYSDEHAPFSTSDLLAEGFIKRLFARHHLRVIRQHLDRGALLEIGAGAGYFLSEAQQAGFEVHGIEINHAQARFMRDILGVPCEEAPFGPDSFGGMLFDMIYLCNVLSHLYDPLAEFQAISDRIKPGGLLVFETGNMGDVEPRYFHLIERFGYPEHLYFFSEKNLHDIVDSIGLELVDIRRYSVLPQLMLSRLRRSLGTRLRSQRGQPAPQSQNPPPDVSASASQQTNGFSLRQFMSFLVRYEVGALAPKQGRPQTVLVLARKRN